MHSPSEIGKAVEARFDVDGVDLLGLALDRQGSWRRRSIYQKSENGQIMEASLKFGKLASRLGRRPLPLRRSSLLRRSGRRT